MEFFLEHHTLTQKTPEATIAFKMSSKLLGLTEIHLNPVFSVSFLSGVLFAHCPALSFALLRRPLPMTMLYCPPCLCTCCPLPHPQQKCWSLPFIFHLTKFHLPSQTEASFPLRSPLCFLLHRPEAPSHLFLSPLAVNFGLSDYLSYESVPELHCLDLCILAARKMSRI